MGGEKRQIERQRKGKGRGINNLSPREGRERGGLWKGRENETVSDRGARGERVIER